MKGVRTSQKIVDEIITDFYDNNISRKEISLKYDMSYNTVTKIISNSDRYHEIKEKERVFYLDVYSVFKRDNLQPKVLASMYNVSVVTIYKILKEAEKIEKENLIKKPIKSKTKHTKKLNKVDSISMFIESVLKVEINRLKSEENYNIDEISEELKIKNHTTTSFIKNKTDYNKIFKKNGIDVDDIYHVLCKEYLKNRENEDIKRVLNILNINIKKLHLEDKKPYRVISQIYRFKLMTIHKIVRDDRCYEL